MRCDLWFKRTASMALCVLLPMLLAGCNLTPPATSEVRTADSSVNETRGADATSRDNAMCSQWSYDPGRIESDLGLMKQVDQATWYRACYQYACSYQGELALQGKPTNVAVNAGGWMSLTSGGKTRYFVSDQQMDGFLATCDCCEEP